MAIVEDHKQVLNLAQARKIDVILVTELTRWGRSTLDLFHTLNDLQSWGVCLIAQTGLQFDLATPQGKLIATLMAGSPCVRIVVASNFKKKIKFEIRNEKI